MLVGASVGVAVGGMGVAVGGEVGVEVGATDGSAVGTTMIAVGVGERVDTGRAPQPASSSKRMARNGKSKGKKRLNDFMDGVERLKSRYILSQQVTTNLFAIPAPDNLSASAKIGKRHA